MASFQVLNGKIMGGPVIPVESMRLLWKNDDDTTSFSEQDINFSDSNYDFLIWIVKQWSTADAYFSEISKKGENVNLATSMTGTKGVYVRRRSASYVDDTTYHMSVGYESNSTDNTVSNYANAAIPSAVYGFKKDSLGGSSGGGGANYLAGDGIDISDDVISVDEMSTEDMSGIISPLPSVQSRRMKYSTEEQIVGEWIDGKPIYQKTITGTTGSDSNPIRVAIGASVDKAINVSGFVVQDPGNVYIPNNFWLNGTSSSNVQGFKIAVFNNSQPDYPNTLVVTANIYAAYQNRPFYATIQYTKTTD